MNATSFQTQTKIHLGETFMRLATGMADLTQVAAERRSAREAAIASEDAYARRRRVRREVTDPFTASFYL